MMGCPLKYIVLYISLYIYIVKMANGVRCINVNVEEWELFLQKFPRKSSEMIRNFVKSAINSPNFEEKEANLEQELLEKEILIQKSKVEFQFLLDKKQRIEAEAEKKAKEELTLDEINWIKTTGVRMIERVGFDKSYSTFCLVHNRPRYSRNKYSEYIEIYTT